MKIKLSFFLIFLSLTSFGQSKEYPFVSNSYHILNKSDSTSKNKNINLDSVIFYDSNGNILDKMNAVMALQNKSNIMDIFLDDSNVAKIIVIRTKTKEEIDKERISQSNIPQKEFKSIRAPLFKAKLLNGKTITYKPNTSKTIYVLNFWFTACVPCRAEIPQLNELVEKFKDKDVFFLAITFEDKANAEKFLLKNNFNYNIAILGSNLVDKFKINSYPTNLVINKKGKIVFKEEGLNSGVYDKLEQIILDGLK